MENIQKEKIVEQLRILSSKSSQNKLAVKAGISAGTLSQMINGKWELIKDEMWNKVRINLGIQFGWQTGETVNYRLLKDLLKTVQMESSTVCISHNAGAGKTHSYKDYAKDNPLVIYVEVMRYWTKTRYVKELVRAAGLDDNGTTDTLIERFIDYIKKCSTGIVKPLVIIDQMDKLGERSFDLVIDIHDSVYKECGFLLSGVPALKKRIESGCRFDKIGYRELKSRINSNYIALPPFSIEDVKNICEANGVQDEEYSHFVYNNSQGDLRRVRLDIEKYFLTNEGTKSV